MSDKTVRQLADMVKTPLEQLLKQLQEAGLSVRTPDDIINDDEQMRLLTHLRKSHGKTQGQGDNSPSRVTLERRKVTEIKQASVPGSSTKTISVEVRKKKTYIKRMDTDEVKPTEPLKTESVEPKQPVEIAVELAPPAETTIIPVVEQQPMPVEETPQVEAVVEVVEQPIKSKPDVKVKAKIELEEAEEGISEPDVDIGSEAKFEALKLKEEKKNKEKSAKTKEAEEARKKQQEKERRLEESIKKNADKVRQQQAAKQPAASHKKQDDAGGGGARSSGKDGKRGKRKGGKQ